VLLTDGLSLELHRKFSMDLQGTPRAVQKVTALKVAHGDN
jgi:hypothetical protein